MSLPDKTDLDTNLREILCHYSSSQFGITFQELLKFTHDARIRGATHFELRKYFELVLRGYKMGELETLVNETESPTIVTSGDFNKTVVKIQRECDPIAGQRKRVRHQELVNDPVINLDGFKDILAMLAAVRFADMDESIAQTTLLSRFVLPLHARLEAEGCFSHLPWRRPALNLPARRKKGISIVSEPTPFEMRSRPRSKSPMNNMNRMRTLKADGPAPLPAVCYGDDPIAELDRQLEEVKLAGQLWRPDSQARAPDQTGLPFTAGAFAEVIASSNPMVTSGLFEIYAKTLCVLESVPILPTSSSKNSRVDSLAPSAIQTAQMQNNMRATSKDRELTTSNLTLQVLGGSVAPFMSADSFFQCVTDVGISPGYVRDEVLADIFARCSKSRAPPPHNTVAAVNQSNNTSTGGMFGPSGSMHPTQKIGGRAAAIARALMEARKRGGTGGASSVGTASVQLMETLSALEFADSIAMVALAAAAEVKISQPSSSPLLEISDARLALRLQQQWGLLVEDGDPFQSDGVPSLVKELKQRHQAKLNSTLPDNFFSPSADFSQAGGTLDLFPLPKTLVGHQSLFSTSISRTGSPARNAGPAPYLDPGVQAMQPMHSAVGAVVTQNELTANQLTQQQRTINALLEAQQAATLSARAANVDNATAALRKFNPGVMSGGWGGAISRSLEEPDAAMSHIRTPLVSPGVDLVSHITPFTPSQASRVNQYFEGSLRGTLKSGIGGQALPSADYLVDMPHAHFEAHAGRSLGGAFLGRSAGTEPISGNGNTLIASRTRLGSNGQVLTGGLADADEDDVSVGWAPNYLSSSRSRKVNFEEETENSSITPTPTRVRHMMGDSGRADLRSGYLPSLSSDESKILGANMSYQIQ